jgi:hypothetical protein
LALYWVATNIVSIVLQYFYAGRKVSLKSMFSFGPAPAPAANRRDGAQQQIEKPSAATEDQAEGEREEPEAVAASEDTKKRRRRRRGRRRR